MLEWCGVIRGKKRHTIKSKTRQFISKAKEIINKRQPHIDLLYKASLYYVSLYLFSSLLLSCSQNVPPYVVVIGVSKSLVLFLKLKSFAISLLSLFSMNKRKLTAMMEKCKINWQYVKRQ